MKETRKIGISEKVFTLEDLRRIAAILNREAIIAKKSDQRASAEYSIRFSDHTTIESDSPDLFSDESFVVPARPVAIRMAFDSYKLNRHLSISINQGDLSYWNEAAISANEHEWLAQNFLSLKETLETVRPQSVWFRKHKTLLLNLMAIGIGTIIVAALDLLVTTVFSAYGISCIGRNQGDSRRFAIAARPFERCSVLVRWEMALVLGAGHFLGISAAPVAVEHVAKY